jgi:hypothetical protein
MGATRKRTRSCSDSMHDPNCPRLDERAAACAMSMPMPRPAPVMNQTALSAIFFSPFLLAVVPSERATEATERSLARAYCREPQSGVVATL